MNSILTILDFGRWLHYHLRCERHRNFLLSGKRDNILRILGNGPSLAEATSRMIVDPSIDYCMVNFSPLSELFFRVQPKYYMMADDGFFKDIEGIRDRIIKLKDRVAAIDWSITLLVPYIYLDEAQKRYGQNPFITVLPFNRGYLSDGFKFRKLALWLYRKGLASPRMMNVVVAALYCMLTLGYKEIELYGVEHSWMKQLIVDDDNRVCMEDPHFYDAGKNNVVLYIGGRPERIWEQLRNQADTFAAYGELKFYADYQGATVINKTRGSYIDAFKRNYE